MNLTKDQIIGVIPPMVTPFDELEKVDEEALIGEIEYLSSRGIHGLVAGGSTGEGPVLTSKELKRICEITVQEVNGKVPVIAGIIPDSTREAVMKGHLVKEVGVDGLMVTPTHYFCPSEEGLVEYYRSIGNEVGLPIIIYNVVPIVPLSPNLIVELAEIREVIGIKQSIGDGTSSPGGQVEVLSETLNSVADKISVLASYDPLLFPGLALGAKGTIGAINTILPDLCLQIYKAVQDGELRIAREVHSKIFPVSMQLKSNNWPSRVKTALNLQCRKVGPARKPMTPLGEKEKNEMLIALKTAGVL